MLRLCHAFISECSLARAIVQIINGSLFAGTLSEMRSHQFPDDGRRCRRCTGRAQVFGLRDPETGYEGYCSVCNLEWHTWQLECRVRFCDRRCAVYCLACIFPVKKNLLILFIRGFLLGGQCCSARNGTDSYVSIPHTTAILAGVSHGVVDRE